MINKDISINGFTIIRSNPSDINGALVTPPSDVTWGTDTSDHGALILLGGLNTDAKFQANTNPGVTVITMACQGKTEQASVTVIAPVILPFDHFLPSFD